MFASTKLIHVDQEAIYRMIYPLAAFENCTITYENFKSIANGESLEHCSDDDTHLIQNLTAACTYMLDTLNEPVSVDYAYRLNEILTNGRIIGSQIRDFDIKAEDLEYIQILKDTNYDLSGYDLNQIVPQIPRKNELDQFMNISKENYLSIINDLAFRQQEIYAYQCFMPMIRAQYFQKSNIITGALIVCKIVLRSKSHLMFIKQENRLDLAICLLNCIYYNDNTPFQKFIDIMIQHRVEMNKNENVKVMIHY